MSNINKNLRSLIVITAFAFGLVLNVPHALAYYSNNQTSNGMNVSYSYMPSNNYQYDNYYPNVNNTTGQYQYNNQNPYNNNQQSAQNNNATNSNNNSATTKQTTKTNSTITSNTSKDATTTTDVNLKDTADQYKNAFAANAMFASNGFLPTNFFQWLLLFIIILAIVFLWRKIYINDHERHAPLKHA